MLKNIIELFKSLIIAVIAAILIITFVFEVVKVDGTSMYKTLNNKDILIIEKITYYSRKPKAGDIVVIKYPSDTRKNFIKRVIAVGGDKLKIVNGNLYINGKLKNESYIFEKMNSYIDENFEKEVTIPKGTIFVMGDNRNDSDDSRFKDVGFVKLNLVVGKAFFRIFPFTRFGRVN